MKTNMRTAILCTILMSSVHSTQCMVSTFYKRFFPTSRQAQASAIPQGTSVHNSTSLNPRFRTIEQAVTPTRTPVNPSIQTRIFHKTNYTQLKASSPTFFSYASDFMRWIKGKPTASQMFSLFDQALKNGNTAALDELIANISSGKFDEIINTAREGQFFANTSVEHYEPQQLTLFDQTISHLIKANKFGPSKNIAMEKYPTPLFSDFFDSPVPRLISLAEALLAKNAKISNDITIFEELAKYHTIVAGNIIPLAQNKRMYENYLILLEHIAEYWWKAHRPRFLMTFNQAFAKYKNEFIRLQHGWQELKKFQEYMNSFNSSGTKNANSSPNTEHPEKIKRTYLRTLGFEHNASEDEIKKAFTTLAKKHHPDKFRTDEEKRINAEKLRECIEAYKYLIANK